ncbi:MAG: ABC transporter permease [Chlamydiota bacterium]|nr:ABC transporter permease [Chlamydiota bacterium]
MRSFIKKEIPLVMALSPLCWQVIFLYVPLFILFLLPFFGGNLRENWEEIFSPHYFYILWRSLCFALATVILSLLIAYPTAYTLSFSIQRGKVWWVGALFLPFLTNFLLHLASWTFLLEPQGIINGLLLRLALIQDPLPLLHSPFSTLLMMVYYYFPLMVLPLFSCFEQMERSLFEAARDLGAHPKQIMSRITLPLSLPAIRTGSFLVFIPAFGEFIIPELIGGNRSVFAGGVISTYILNADTQHLGMAFTLMSGLFLGLSGWLLAFLFRWLERRGRNPS